MSGLNSPRARMFLKTSSQPRLATERPRSRRRTTGAQEGRKGVGYSTSAPDQNPPHARDPSLDGKSRLVRSPCRS